MVKETKKEREAREKAESATKATIKGEGSLKTSPATPTKADLSGMIGHLKYNASKSEDIRTALQQYQQAPTNQVKHELWHLFKSDKTCKWSKNFSGTTESKSSTSTGTLSGVCTWCLY